MLRVTAVSSTRVASTLPVCDGFRFGWRPCSLLLGLYLRGPSYLQCVLLGSGASGRAYTCACLCGMCMSEHAGRGSTPPCFSCSPPVKRPFEFPRHLGNVTCWVEERKEARFP